MALTSSDVHPWEVTPLTANSIQLISTQIKCFVSITIAELDRESLHPKGVLSVICNADLCELKFHNNFYPFHKTVYNTALYAFTQSSQMSKYIDLRHQSLQRDCHKVSHI